MAGNARAALAEGLADAAGFLAGALLGWQAGRLLGVDVLASGLGPLQTAAGWALLLAGCGAGKWASMQWKARRRPGADAPRN